ncbi:MAG TPA: DUF3306 domain-containing protein [Alphaproteobacteria bacterium]
MSNEREKPDRTVVERPLATPGPDQEPFLSRWSRRKQEVRDAPPAAKAEPADPPSAEPPIDPATLPPIDSLGADSDFTVFLRRGVPESLRNAALQKLWRTEPSVVNYVPLVEYNWDFNAPGYGALRPGDDVAKLARRVWGGVQGLPHEPEPAAAPDTGSPTPSGTPEISAETPAAPAESAETPAEVPQAPPRRRHGGALPS